MESVSCPLCGEDKSTELWIKSGARSVRCSKCGLVYENPRFDSEELKKFYSSKDYYVSDDPDLSASGYKDYFAQCSPVLQREYFRLLTHFNRKQGKIRYLDIGSGPGGIVQLAGEAGWDATGLELSSWAVHQGLQSGLRMIEGTLHDADIPDQSFDVISMFDVLEHLPQPVEYMREIYRILSPGGMVFVETPNVEGLFAKHLYKEDSDLVKPRAHICLYSPNTAKRLFDSVPFSEVNTATFPWCRQYTPGYFKSLLVSRLKKVGKPTQLTFNESMRVIAWK